MKERLKYFFEKHKEVILYICLPLLYVLYLLRGRLTFKQWFFESLKKSEVWSNNYDIAFKNPKIVLYFSNWKLGNNRHRDPSLYYNSKTGLLIAKSFSYNESGSFVNRDDGELLVSELPVNDYNLFITDYFDGRGSKYTLSEVNLKFDNISKKYSVFSNFGSDQAFKNMEDYLYYSSGMVKLWRFIWIFGSKKFFVLGQFFDYKDVAFVFKDNKIFIIKTKRGIDLGVSSRRDERMYRYLLLVIEIKNASFFEELKVLLKDIFVNDKGQIIEL